MTDDAPKEDTSGGDTSERERLPNHKKEGMSRALLI